MMPGKSRLSFVAGLVLFIAAIPALADHIQLTFTGGIGSFARSSYHDGGGIYMATYPGSSQLQTLCCTVVDLQGEHQGFFSFPEFSLPAGDKIFSAKLTLLFPSVLQYSYEPEITQILPPPDPDQLSVPGHILATVKTTAFAELFDSGCSFSASVTGFDLLSHGCNLDLPQLSVFADSVTAIYPSVISTGFNSSEEFDVQGENAGPVSGEIDIVYGVAPEPGSLILLGTAMVLAGAMKRRLVHRAALPKKSRGTSRIYNKIK